MKRLGFVLILALCLILVLSAFAPGAMAKRKVAPSVVPPGGTVAGLSYADWSAKWWQWVLAIPQDQSPFFDPTGANAAVGQSGDVFFLCGTMEYDWAGIASADRFVKVPPGKYIFLPVINGEMSPPEGWEGGPQTWPELVAFCESYIDQVTVKDLTVDGHKVASYRVKTTKDQAAAPTYTMPKGGVFPIEPGTYPFFSDGYWAMLEPLSMGSHRIVIHGVAEGDGWVFETLVRYHLVVTDDIED